MDKHRDPYDWLRAPVDTKPEELCKCENLSAITLQAHLAFNPLVCLVCNCEVHPNRVSLTPEQAETIYNWHGLYESLYLLWLGSGEYEQWAKERLEDPNGDVNVMGRSICDALSLVVPSYYWWFHDTCDHEVLPVTKCPVCKAPTIKQYGGNICEQCRVIVSA